MRYCIHITSVLILVLTSILHPAQRDSTIHSRFLEALINDSPSLDTFVLAEERTFSTRLGISFSDVSHKFLISYDLHPVMKSEVREGRLNMVPVVRELSEGYSLLHLTVGNNYSKEFIFRGEKLVSPVYYYTRQWTSWESEHIRFLISDTLYFNRYSVAALESFVVRMMDELEYTVEQRDRLREKKILYVLCSDVDEIERLTGFKTRGMYVLAFDYVVTTYNAHYHELVHLLVNFKLQRLPLFTHELFQEGLAVAYGGRGGVDPSVMLHAAHFIITSEFLRPDELFDRNEFLEHDPSVSYPVAGLYNDFLMKTLSTDSYLSLYRRYSSSDDSVSYLSVTHSDLPPERLWNAFLDSIDHDGGIVLDPPPGRFEPVMNDSSGEIAEGEIFYRIRTGGIIRLAGKDTPGRYASRQFNELVHQASYRGEKYLILSDTNEIGVYNLLTNNRIAGRVRTFSHPSVPFPRLGDQFEFYIRKSVFDEPLRRLSISR